MGDVIVKSFAKSLPARDFEAGHSAEILFFTGVRYYRMEETVELPAVTKRGNSKPLMKRRLSPDQRRAAKLKREQRLEALA